MDRSGQIGFITTSFPRFKEDSAGSFVFGMARSLATRGHHIDVLVPDPPTEADWSDHPPWLEGIRVIPAPYARPKRYQSLFFGAGVPDNLSNNPLRAALAIPAAASLAVTLHHCSRYWDAMVSHWLLPSALIAGWGSRRSLRHLAIAHSGDVHLLSRLPFSSALASFILRGSDHMGFISKTLREEFMNLLMPERVERFLSCSSVTPMGIDFEDLTTSKDRSLIRKEMGLSGFTLLYLGRLVPIKGVDILIDSLSKIGDATLLVAGDGPERERLRLYASKKNVNAQFLGPVAHTMRAELLRAADLLVVPSRILENGRHEGLPLVVSEGMAAQTAVLASRTGAIDELIIDQNNGFLVEPGDPVAMETAIQSIRDNMKIMAKLKRNAQNTVRERSWKVLASTYEKLLLA